MPYWQRFMILMFGSAIVVGCIIDTYFGDAQFQWPEWQYRLTLLGTLLAGAAIAYLTCRRDDDEDEEPKTNP